MVYLILLTPLLIMAIMMILYRIYFIQCGPTCGFYATVYACNKLKKRSKRKDVRKLLFWALDEGKTQIGEIFTRDVMSEVIESYAKESGLTASMIKTHTRKQIEDILDKGQIVIVPYMGIHTVHYCVLFKEKGAYKMWHSGKGRTQDADIDALIRSNKDLPRVFYWNAYMYSGRPPFSLKNRLIRWLIDGKIGKRLYREYNSKMNDLSNRSIKITVGNVIWTISNN